jgi:hypothetical protein
MNKKIALAMLLVAVLGTGMFASTNVFAETAVDNNPMSALVQKIADKFGLKASDVQAIFTQDQVDRKTEMEKKFLEQLAQDVKDGKITDAQKQLIIAKRKEVEANHQTEMQTMQGKTEAERKTLMEANKTKMDTERKALEDWAKQNEIDMKYLMGGSGMHGGPGPDGMGKPPEGTPPAGAPHTATTQ